VTTRDQQTISLFIRKSNDNRKKKATCTKLAVRHDFNKLCGSRHNMPRPSPPSVGAEAPRAAEPTASDRNVKVGSHGEYVPTATAVAV